MKTRKDRTVLMNKGIGLYTNKKTGNVYYRVSISIGDKKSKAYYFKTFNEAVVFHSAKHFEKYGTLPVYSQYVDPIIKLQKQVQ
jgi:hypothetical protein